jgi:hypothetical protein
MDELKWLESAAGRMSAPPPSIDVTHDVMRTLREREAPQPVSMLLGVAIAGCSFAVISIVFAQQAVAAWHDPLGDLLRF